MECCCGKHNCAFLEQNNAAITGLEREITNAARMGQVRTLSSVLCAFGISDGRTCVLGGCCL